jgi:hypothetical protein
MGNSQYQFKSKLYQTFIGKTGKIKMDCYREADILSGGYLSDVSSQIENSSKLIGKSILINKDFPIKIIDIIEIDNTGLGRYKTKFNVAINNYKHGTVYLTYDELNKYITIDQA